MGRPRLRDISVHVGFFVLATPLKSVTFVSRCNRVLPKVAIPSLQTRAAQLVAGKAQPFSSPFKTAI